VRPEAELVERIQARAERVGLSLDAATAGALASYWVLLDRWNRRINLTALPLQEYPAGSIDRLIVEPLVAAQHLDDSKLEWIDLGSGGGSPAIPLKILRPATVLTMIESRTRKAAYLREAVRTLGLGATAVLTERFESPGTEQARRTAQIDLITIRGLKIDAVLLTHVFASLRRSGRLFVFGFAGLPKLTGQLRLAEPVLIPLPGGSNLAILSRSV
jgi:16S rRNA (guanine527-N7)-methyltransferase